MKFNSLLLVTIAICGTTSLYALPATSAKYASVTLGQTGPLMLPSNQNKDTIVASAVFKGDRYKAYKNSGIYRVTNSGSTRVYSGSQIALKMLACGDYLYTAFSGKGIYRSPDGNNVGGGGRTRRVYKGSQYVVSMRCSSGGVITKFSGGGIYLSPDGNNLGGGGGTRRI